MFRHFFNKFMNMGWKPVVGYEGIYEVHAYGMVRSLDRLIKPKGRKPYKKKGVVLKEHLSNGYYTVQLCRNGNISRKQTHRLVAEAFINNDENKPCVNHKDFNRLNNTYTNLEWCTQKENIRHATDNGRTNAIKGERVNTNKLTKQDVVAIRKRADAGQNMNQIARDYGVRPNTIHDIKTRKNWWWL